MAGMTNRGKQAMFDSYFRNQGTPTNFYVALVTSATAPTADINTLGQLTEVSNGNGYTTGGVQLSRNATDFDSLVEDDTNDRADLQIKDVVWTATGGSISGARYSVLTDDHTTVSQREVLAYWDLTSNRTVSAGQTLTLQNLELRATE